MKSGYYRNPAVGEARTLMVWKKFRVKSSVAGRSLEEIQRIVDHCKKLADSEAQKAFGAAQ